MHTLAFRDLGFRLSYLALVDGPVLSSACEDTHGEEMAELLLGLEGDGETWQRGTGFRGCSMRGERGRWMSWDVYTSRVRAARVHLGVGFLWYGT